MTGLWGELCRTASLVAAGLLCLAAVAKVTRPEGAMGTLTALRLPPRRALVRSLAALEFTLGAVHLARGSSVTAVLIGAAYAGFAALAAYALRSQGAGVPCGCFGHPDAAFTPVHIGVDLVIAATTLCGAVLGSAQGLPAGTGLTVAIFVAVAAIATYLARLALVELGSLLGLFRWRPPTRARDVIEASS